MITMKKRQPILFPKTSQSLARFGESIELAAKRRKFTQVLIAQRTGLDRRTVKKIFAGDPTVSLGHYLMVLAIMGMDNNFEQIAANDELGRKLQDLELLGRA